MKMISGGVCAAKGYKANGVHCGIRKNRTKRDIALVVSDVKAAAAAVYTQNLVKGAPLQGRALHQVLGIHRRSSGLHIAHHQGNIPLGAVLADTAMHAVCFIAFCGTYAAGNHFHISSLLLQGRFFHPHPIQCSYSAPLRRWHPCPDCQTGPSAACGLHCHTP